MSSTASCLPCHLVPHLRQAVSRQTFVDDAVAGSRVAAGGLSSLDLRWLPAHDDLTQRRHARPRLVLLTPAFVLAHQRVAAIAPVLDLVAVERALDDQLAVAEGRRARAL